MKALIETLALVFICVVVFVLTDNVEVTTNGLFGADRVVVTTDAYAWIAVIATTFLGLAVIFNRD